jgi:hypothetical protein
VIDTWFTEALRTRVLSFIAFGDPARLVTGEVFFLEPPEKREGMLSSIMSANQKGSNAARRVKTCFLVFSPGSDCFGLPTMNKATKWLRTRPKPHTETVEISGDSSMPPV